ncbi:beta-glucosidase [bacterium]|nr:beta-glucosidase [bacterium]
MSTNNLIQFPENFHWGTATAAYQIEGAPREGGKGESIWDRFSHIPGKIHNNENADMACDHYHRWQDDVKLMAEMGINSYRFSLAWTRILPQGYGALNDSGLSFYDKLIDELLANNIKPFVTLYHWDLPQALQDRGGWANRDTAYYFRDYAGEVSLRYGDRVKNWITHNEPAVTTFIGHHQGVFAPGIADLKTALQTAHHLMLSHGLAIPVLQENGGGKAGITLDLAPAHPASDSDADQQAAKREFDQYCNWFLLPLFKGAYPEEMAASYEAAGLMPEMQPEDMAHISVKTDFLGINYYRREITRHLKGANFWDFEIIPSPNGEFSEMGWEVYPAGFYEILQHVHETYQPPEIYITESGIALPDKIDTDGKVHDPRRISYLHQHFQQAKKVIDAGIPLKGYFVWSLLDNFEWASGFSKRFGLFYMNYATQERMWKDSARWYQQVVRQNGIEILE